MVAGSAGIGHSPAAVSQNSAAVSKHSALVVIVAQVDQKSGLNMTTIITTPATTRAATKPRFQLEHPMQGLAVVMRSAAATVFASMRPGRPHDAPTQQTLGRVGSLASSPR